MKKPKGLLLSVRESPTKVVLENAAPVGGGLDVLTRAATPPTIVKQATTNKIANGMSAATTPTIAKQATTNKSANGISAFAKRTALVDATPRTNNVSRTNSIQMFKPEPQKRAPLRIKITLQNIVLPKTVETKDIMIPFSNKVLTSSGDDATGYTAGEPGSQSTAMKSATTSEEEGMI